MNDTPTTPVVTTDWPWAPIPEAVLYARDLDPLAVRVYGCLLRHGLTPDSCYPTHKRIGDLIGVSKRSVNRPLRDLEEAGWVRRVPRFDQRGDRTSDGFHVRTSLDASSAPSAPASADPPTSASADPPRQPARTEKESNGKESQLNEIVVSDDVRRLCDLLAELMVANGCRPPSITKTGWLDPIRLLIEKDGIEPERVERAIRWSQADEFWRANIHSGKALREKYDTLRQQARRAKQGGGSTEAILDARTEFLRRRGRAS